ncbi:hypothetical protein [Plasmodium yoelii yoelii]|uniref:Uncharacterized protein n=1 Tax=Plasmodium yoelii yoelii TaxID=73239 RepID=Q7RJQ6_PLAYO|nr:hypothetical protein [Plasmodium yoelii yoelii]
MAVIETKVDKLSCYICGTHKIKYMFRYPYIKNK